jgi:hypothetical protein
MRLTHFFVHHAPFGCSLRNIPGHNLQRAPVITPCHIPSLYTTPSLISSIIAFLLPALYFGLRLNSLLSRSLCKSRFQVRKIVYQRQMSVCPTCDNRPFATKEALLQHVRTSSNAHPFCLACDRRFASELAYNAVWFNFPLWFNA